MSTLKSIELFFQEGTSDKVYNASICEDGDGLFTVRVAWGRRGTGLSTGTKAVRVPLAAAERAYERVIREKTAKGYEAVSDGVRPAEVAPPVGQGSASRAASRPGARVRLPQEAQLLNPVGEQELERLLEDDGVVAQQKLDGIRLLAHVGESAVVTNRRGQVTSAPEPVTSRLGELAAGTLLDGELVKDEYWLFDLLSDEGEDLRPLGYLDRYRRLEDLCRITSAPLRLVPIAIGSRAKRALLERLTSDRAEGIVLKRIDAPYRPGRPGSGGTQLKFKLVKSADVVILANAGNAYLMGVHDERGRLHEIGKVFAGTTSESRRELDLALGAGERPVAEVRYLYATDDAQLYQPVFCQLRDDKEPEDCRLDQLQRTSRAVLSLPQPSSLPPEAGGATRRVLELLNRR